MITTIKQRSIISITGADRKNFIQPLITANLNHISDGRAIYGALLTPQGKFLHDFFISEANETLYVECETDRKDNLLKRLTMYKLRADATFTDHSDDLYILASLEPAPFKTLVSYPDPRHSKMGYRAISNQLEHQSLNEFDYLNHRLSLGIGEGAADFIPEKSPVLEGNYEELNAVDFTKGCYVGQEVTARMKYRGTLKKRLFPLKLKSGFFKTGDNIYSPEDKKIGTIRSATKTNAIALINFTRTDLNLPFHSDNAELEVYIPDFIKLSEK